MSVQRELLFFKTVFDKCIFFIFYYQHLILFKGGPCSFRYSIIFDIPLSTSNICLIKGGSCCSKQFLINAYFSIFYYQHLILFKGGLKTVFDKCTFSILYYIILYYQHLIYFCSKGALVLQNSQRRESFLYKSGSEYDVQSPR